VDGELDWRIRHDRLEHGVVAQAKCLHAWLRQHLIKAPQTSKAVENYIRKVFQNLNRESAPPGPRRR
jgi:hypothetical protein